MIWLVGLILFIVELYVLLHTTYCEYKSSGYYRYEIFNYGNPLDIRVYHIILLLLCNLWWLSAITAVVFFMVYLVKASKPGNNSGGSGTIWKLEDNLLAKKISINKEQ